ncbi:MAG: hypothetical protein AMJ90_06250 [candidate division Zixibacteria bacterium SM23_73_2]|nr:MAG: hypothetical protein AMJ90_06250 [candidate division Zixibacteria bacterium SM23_73_2]
MNIFSRISILSLIALLLICLSNSNLPAQEAEDDTIKSITCIRANPGVKVDGILDEDFWQKAPKSGEFIQYEPDHGEPETESTFVRVAYDDEALYVAMEMYDSEPDKIIGRLTRRDRYVESDLVNVIIDSHHDHQTAYAFTLYVSGTQKDTYYYNDNWSDDSWDAVWESATQITDWGWTAELKIPFHCLRFSCEENPVWGFYCSRRICRKHELDRWIYIPESAGGFVSHFGHLKGLKNLTPPKRLEILPYVVSYEETEEKSLGNPDGRDFFGNMGFDLKYGITSDITLDATVNPDFGQVEQDETVLNLSTYEWWYEEKRPFFLEGFKIFETPFDLFYSRRIGKSPSIWPDSVDYYIHRPASTTILFAGKVSGKTSGGTSIGLLEAVTQKERANFRHEGGYDKKDVIEPEANYLVARVMQDVLKNSTVGIMATAVNQKYSYPAYTGGVDWTLRFRDGDYQFKGNFIGSKTELDDKSWGGALALAKDGGEHIRGEISAYYLDRGLDLNHIGFLRRADYKEVWCWVQYKTIKEWWIVRRSWNNFNIGYEDNLSGLKLARGGNFNNSIQLTNNWNIGGGIWMDYDNAYHDDETQGGPPAPIPKGQNWWVWIETDGSKWWQINPYFETGDTWDGKFYSYSLWFNLHPRSNIEVSVGPEFYRCDGVSRWLTYLEDENENRTDEIFGEQHVRRFDMTLRGTYTFNKDLTLQVYAQPFIAAVDYRNFKKLVQPDGFEYVSSDVYDEEKEQPDYNWTSFNSNLVLRWEYRPGSTLFLVWTQNRGTKKEGVGNFRFRNDWDNLFNTIPGNTFLIKANYWWTL